VDGGWGDASGGAVKVFNREGSQRAQKIMGPLSFQMLTTFFRESVAARLAELEE